ncbi:hypothetical protein FEM48_Zijuj05G0170100 [Ziziphus jujuba var. spinosa]|uniref:Uncharacterized protein n=1 Tax=Ziziphus jujuba var. spinosa TaxID=714518 RepID=A0A978VG13_ZIZJJ|nr:hypothetical protein FEM48_Zijuj05G0170100 [Ziziphus jujuba var. spinosa]
MTIAKPLAFNGAVSVPIITIATTTNTKLTYPNLSPCLCSEAYETSPGLLQFSKPSNIQGSLVFGLSQRKVQTFSTLNQIFSQ